MRADCRGNFLKASVKGNVERGRLKRKYTDSIDDVFKKGQVGYARNGRECIKRLMKLLLASSTTTLRFIKISMWRSVRSAYTYGSRYVFYFINLMEDIPSVYIITD